MNRLSSFLLSLAALLTTQFASAQEVFVNFKRTLPGDHDVRSGSLVIVRNTTDADVTITIPYQPPITVPPGRTGVFTVTPNPGGSTYVEGSGGNWRFNAVGATP